MRIAIVDDDGQLAELMQIWLEARGYVCSTFTSGRAFLADLKRETYDLVIQDWMMPDLDGEAVLARLRSNPEQNIPVIFVTSRSREDDIAHILNLGADDYITKPVHEKELLARIAAVTRRTMPEQHKQSLEVAPYLIDVASHSVSKDSVPLNLTQKEFDLVLFLFRNTGKLLSRGHILSSVWGHEDGFSTRTVDTHMSRIRKKLDINPDNGWKLSAIYHQGYRLERVDAQEQPV
ncbi:MAG: response regulator transcription factor [Gammaproteobacteria bacterium]